MTLELGVVHELEVLAEMVFAIEGPLLLCLFLAREEIVRFKMLWSGVELMTEDAMSASRSWHCDGGSVIGTASPPLENQVQRLLMPLPIVLGWEGDRTEGALEYASRPSLCLLGGSSLSHRGSPTSTSLCGAIGPLGSV